MKSIWFKDYTLDDVKYSDTILEPLGIEVTEIGKDYLVGTMPVDKRTWQPAKLLHGGASVVLAETLGSIGANLIIDNEKYYAVGLEVNANHIGSVTSGFVKGIAKPIHVGKTTQVWSIDIKSDTGKPVCISRLTMAVLQKK
jgi:1,4-dihydroxy-2-naphthoyl-CoA hydrolase